MDDIVKRIRQQSYFGLEPYEAADEIEQLRQRVAELEKERDELLAALEKFLDDNNPEGFGCACEPGRLCGPCSEAKRQRPLYAAIASVKELQNGY